MTQTLTAGPTLADLLPDWRTHLRARNLSAKTITAYMASARNLIDYLTAQGMPTTPAGVTREHLEAWLSAELARPKKRGGGPMSAAQVNHLYRSVQQFFRWIADEGEITASPMARMKPPKVPEQPVPVLSDADLAAMLKARSGADFTSRRDTALLRLLLDSGCRLAEVAGLTVEDVDQELEEITVMGKGRRSRRIPYGPKTAEALSRYLRLRRSHPWAARSTKLWLGRQGPMSGDGIYQMVERVAAVAGLGPVHPHQLRHTAAHAWLAAGNQETDLMRLMGWKSRQMVGRYAASAADERAREAHRRARLGDRV